MAYPADVQAALDHAATEGWTVECYQAVLGIALHHLEKPVRPEVVAMYAEEPTPFATMGYKTLGDERVLTEVESIIPSDTIYLVCPVCLRRTTPEFNQEAIESATMEWGEGDVDDTAVLYVDRYSWDTSGDGEAGWLVCGNTDCYAELDWPAFLEFSD